MSKQHVQNPVTIANSLIGVKYDGGILLVSDLSVSYGSQYKFSNVSHMRQLTPTCVVGGSGELGDFQELAEYLEKEIRTAQCQRSGEALEPSEIHNYIKRIMYQRRTKMNPFVCNVVTAGVNPDKSLFLGCVQMHGTAWEDNIISTGFAAHFQGTQLAEVVGKDRQTVSDALMTVVTAIYARQNTATGKLELFDITPQSITRTVLDEPVPSWEICDHNDATR